MLVLLIAGIVIIYKRRKRALGEKIEDYPPEKGYYWTPPEHQDGARTQSEIMDQAMAAAYAAENGTSVTRWPSGQPHDADEADAYSQEPVAPGPAYFPANTDAAAQSGTETKRPGSWTQAAPYLAPAVPPTPVEDLSIYPPGQVPIDRYRVPSMAQTEVTTTTESTWRTWNVDQSGAQKPKGWKERYLR